MSHQNGLKKDSSLKNIVNLQLKLFDKENIRWFYQQVLPNIQETSNFSPKLFQRIEKEGVYLILFYEAGVNIDANN